MDLSPSDGSSSTASSAERGCLERRDRQNEERFLSNSISSTTRRDSVGQLRQVQLAASPQQAGQNPIKRQCLADSRIHSGHLRRSSRSGLPRQRSCAQAEGSRPPAGDGQDDADLGSTPAGSLEVGLRDRILLELDMTNAFVRVSCSRSGWKCSTTGHRTLTIVETIYKGKIRTWGKTKRVSPDSHSRKLADDLSMASGVKKRPGRHSPRARETPLRCRQKCSCSRTKMAASWTRTTFASGSCTSSLGARLAEADVPGHPQNDRNAGPEEGHSEGRSRCHAALTYGDDHRCLHAGDPGSVQATINSINLELRNR